MRHFIFKGTHWLYQLVICYKYCKNLHSYNLALYYICSKYWRQLRTCPVFKTRPTSFKLNKRAWRILCRLRQQQHVELSSHLYFAHVKIRIVSGEQKRFCGFGATNIQREWLHQKVKRHCRCFRFWLKHFLYKEANLNPWATLGTWC